jgi:cyclase
VSQAVNIPVIASGGGGDESHFVEIFGAGEADAALAASIFHYQEVEIMHLKDELIKNNLPIRK